MPAVKRFSVSFAQYPTNGMSAFFSSIFPPPHLPCVLHDSNTLVFLLQSVYISLLTVSTMAQLPFNSFQFPFIFNSLFLDFKILIYLLFFSLPIHFGPHSSNTASHSHLYPGFPLSSGAYRCRHMLLRRVFHSRIGLSMFSLHAFNGYSII